MPDKKVLIITYYWPPSGGSGVQRWLKFVKYLPEFGWKPYVFTPENPAVVIKDESLLKDVPDEAVIVKLPIWEPYRLFGKLAKIFTGNKKSDVQTDFVNTQHSSLFSKISLWVRGNLFVPDPRKFWARPAVKFLEKYLEENQINTIISTGPPHSMHLIGFGLKKRNPSLRWIVDMRDPWSEWGFLDSIKAGSRAKAKHRKLEHKVLTTADEILTITPFYARQFERLSGRKVNLITNGFDADDFQNFKLTRSDKFCVLHVGLVNEKCDPRPFMKAVKELCLENESIKKEIEIVFVGQINSAFKDFIASDRQLSSITTVKNSVPHDQLIEIYASGSVLLLILTGYKDAEGYMPGKLFEYLATGLPVLGVGPENGDAAALLTETNSGKMIDGNESEAIKKFVKHEFVTWKNGAVHMPGNSARYSRVQTTANLVELLER